MCGIIGALTKKKNLKDIVFKSLHDLSYRGYDSSGFVSFLNNNSNGFNIIKSIGGICNLEKKLLSTSLFDINSNTTGLAHTRWATHGEVKEENTHPLYTDYVCAVHNGIIENYHEIKNKLINEGVEFKSKTDTELIPILITKFIKESNFSKLQAISECFKILKGSFAVGIIFHDEPYKIYAYKNGSPLIFSYSEDFDVMCISSDIFSIESTADYFVKIQDGEILVLDIEDNNKKYLFFNAFNLDERKKHEVFKIQKSCIKSSLECFESYMEKEIYEQPKAILSTINNLYDSSKNLYFIEDFFTNKNIPKILKIIGCGSSYIAANIGAQYLKQISLINVSTEYGSELKNSNDPYGIYDMMIFISQSGETADILHSANEIRACCSKKIVSLTNNIHSTLASISDYNLITKAEQEISVASTKTFTTQVSVFMVLSIYFAKIKNIITNEESIRMLNHLLSAPQKIKELLYCEDFLNQIKDISKIISKQANMLFIGRGLYYQVASEASLKLKEISYINSHSLFAGELKHGPIALIDESSYVFIICPNNEYHEKNIVTIEEILTRKANIIILTDSLKTKDYFSSNEKVYTIFIDYEHDIFVSPFLFILSIQLIAYYTAKNLNRNIDKPRNLAKSVTVE